VVLQELLSEFTHVIGDRELPALHVAAHLLDRGLGGVAAAFVLRVRRQHRGAEPAVNVRERLA
jgi:hypothetical protein